MTHRVFRHDLSFSFSQWIAWLLLALAWMIPCAGSVAAQSDTAFAELVFTAPGDDGRAGRATAYDIRYSGSPINQSNWGQATPVQDNVPAPGAAGTIERITVSIPNALLGTTYHFAIKARDEAFNWSVISNSAPFYYGIGAGTGDDDPLLPDRFVLRSNYPNPFNASTRIEFDVPAPAAVKLTIWNALGQRVRDLLDEDLPPGTHQVLWDGTDYAGRVVPSGTYFYQLTSGNFATSRGMTLLK